MSDVESTKYFLKCTLLVLIFIHIIILIFKLYQKPTILINVAKNLVKTNSFNRNKIKCHLLIFAYFLRF